MLPILPAGLRPARRDPKALLVSPPTMAYRAVWEAHETARRVLSQDGHVHVAAQAVAELQRAVEGLFIGAAGERSGSLADRLAAFEGAAVDDLRQVHDEESFVMTLRGSLFIWRALVEASCLEPTFLREDGSVDEAQRARSLIDSAANRNADVYDRVLSSGWTPHDLVFHGPHVEGAPHVDVFSFHPRGPGQPILCITGGMRSQPMNPTGTDHLPPAPPRAPMRIELACLVDPASPAEVLDAVRRNLLSLALFPYRSGAWFGDLHDIGIGAPLVPGSPLTSWLLLRLDAPWTRRLRRALPTHPVIHTVTAITEAEVRFKIEHGGVALYEKLREAGALRIAPHRASVC